MFRLVVIGENTKKMSKGPTRTTKKIVVPRANKPSLLVVPSGNSLFIVLTYALFSLIYTKKVVKLVNTGSLGLSIEKFAGSSPVLFNINII